MADAKQDLSAALLQPRPGWLLAAVSVLAAIEAFGLLRRGLLFVWPGLLLAGGLAAAAELALGARRRGLPVRGLLADTAARPRLVLAGLALAGGLGEVLRAANPLGTLAAFIWPLCLLALAVLLLASAAQSAGPTLAGRVGALLLLAGLLRGFEAVFGVQPGAVGTGWFVVLFVAAVAWLRAAPPPTRGDGP